MIKARLCFGVKVMPASGTDEFDTETVERVVNDYPSLQTHLLSYSTFQVVYVRKSLVTIHQFVSFYDTIKVQLTNSDLRELREAVLKLHQVNSIVVSCMSWLSYAYEY